MKISDRYGKELWDGPETTVRGALIAAVIVEWMEAHPQTAPETAVGQ